MNQFSFDDIVLLKGYEGKLFEVTGIIRDKDENGKMIFTYDLEDLKDRSYYMGCEEDMIFHSKVVTKKKKPEKTDKIDYLDFTTVDEGLRVLNDLLLLKKMLGGSKTYTININKVKGKLAELSQV